MFKDGNIPWNKGKKGVQKSWNKGKTGIYSEETIQKMREARLGVIPSNKGNKKYKKICKGCGIEFRTIRKDKKFHIRECYYLYNRGENSSFYGKNHTEKTKKRLGEIKKGKKLNISKERMVQLREQGRELGKSRIGREAWNKGKKCPQLSEAKKKFYKEHPEAVEARKGKNNSNYGNKWDEEQKQRGRERIIKFLSSGNMPNKKTSIEIALEEELERVGLNFQSNVPLCKIGIVDFLLSDYDIIVQADGLYWHSSDKVKKRDATQDLIYSFKGYKVFRFWEDEIKESPKKCINKVLKYVRR